MPDEHEPTPPDPRDSAPPAGEPPAAGVRIGSIAGVEHSQVQIAGRDLNVQTTYVAQQVVVQSIVAPEDEAPAATPAPAAP